MYKQKISPDRNHKIIVSLTSTSFRIRYILPVIKTLLNQTVIPDKIILWLSNEKYLLDDGIDYRNIPGKVRKLADTNPVFEIKYTENTGPYRKLLPVLRDCMDNKCVIVTADDDIIYPDYWLEKLYTSYLKSNCITCYRARELIFKDNKIADYSFWPVLDYKDSRRDLLICATGNNGVLYSPEFFSDAIFNPVFKEICPSRCDIWFFSSALINRVPTEHLGMEIDLDESINIKDSRFPRLSPELLFKKYRKLEWPELWKYNKPLNDNIISKVFNHFQIDPGDFIK